VLDAQNADVCGKGTNVRFAVTSHCRRQHHDHPLLQTWQGESEAARDVEQLVAAPVRAAAAAATPRSAFETAISPTVCGSAADDVGACHSPVIKRMKVQVANAAESSSSSGSSSGSGSGGGGGVSATDALMSTIPPQLQQIALVIAAAAAATTTKTCCAACSTPSSDGLTSAISRGGGRRERRCCQSG